MKRMIVTAAVVMFCAAAFAEDKAKGNCGGGSNRGRHGLVAHYYRDAVEWDGNWEAGSKPQADPADETFTKYSHSRVEPLVNHLFIRRGWFSVRWQGKINIPGRGDGAVEVAFEIWADDGCRLKIDGETVIDDWRDVSESATESHRSGTVTLTPGKHDIVVEYFQGESLRRDDKDPIKLYWALPGRGKKKTIVPAAAFTYEDDDLYPKAGRKDPKGEAFREMLLERLQNADKKK